MIDPEHQRHVDDVCEAALARETSERAAFVIDACGNDDALRLEVEALLAHAERAEQFLSTPITEVAASMMEDERASLVGRQFGSYQILALLGVGGMGEVYRAHDTKLGRDVAIKVLPSEFVSDPERLTRFEREARVLAALNHPNIGAIYELEETGGVRGLVLELVEGVTLAERLVSGPLAIREALIVARQVAEALEAAHERGIVHRDLKPANITLRSDGTVKVLDFGLAKVAAKDARAAALSQLQSETIWGSGGGVIRGTAAYMSPEQARGQRVDSRTDIWSFGCVLYEMLAGRQALGGETLSDAIAAILERQPDWTALPAATPANIRALLQRCLEKNARQRLRDVGDARLEIDQALAVDVDGMSAPGVRPSDQAALAKSSMWRSRRALAAAIVFGIVAAVLAWRVRSASVEVLPIRSIAVLPLRNLSGDPEQEYFSDGTTEALISRLAQIRAVDVISRTSIMRYKGTTKSLQEIGRELRVDAIVEGSVQRAGGRVRVTAEVIRVSTDKHLWAGTYERDQADILKLEADAAVAIAQQIVAHVTPEEGHRLASAPRVDPTAHEEYLLGEHSLLPGPSDLPTARQAVAHFTRAIDFQPDYADAFAGLALARQNLGQLDAARTAAETALRFDPDLSEAHTAIAGIMTAKYDWRGAEREYQRALDQNPNTLTACVCYSVFLRMTGRFAQAFALIQRTAAMDPLSSAVQAEFGTVLFMWRKYDEAIPHFERAIELDARNRFASYTLSLTYEMLGRPEQSLALLDRAEFRPSAELGLAYASLGRRSDALSMISDLEKKGAEPDDVTVALVFFTLRDTDRGFHWLTRAFDERQGRANFIKFHPMFDTVRSDPRFTALIGRLNLPDP